MINQLITALSKEVGLSAEEIADTIWLALHMGQAESISSDFPLIQEDEAGINNRDSKETSSKLQPKTSDSQEIARNQPTEEQKAGIYPRTQNQTSTGSDLSFKVPDAPSLREPLTLARALKPLMRRFPSGTTLVLDEAATIQRIADEGLWLPVLRPTLEPWLDLELVVDESISMQIWRHTIRDLERLLKNYGIFRDVRVWGLIADEQEQVQIRRGIGATAKNQPLRSPAELIDPSGRRLVLVVSDCVSSLWRNGKVMSALEIWSKRGVMAIVQMLPKWLWKRTALGRASEMRLQGLIPGVFNQKLIAKEVSWWDELEEDRGIKVPVFTLEPDKVATWAQMLAGRGSIWTLGYVFKLDATSVNKESKLFNLDYAQLSAEQRVQAFRVTASPMARKLAGLLAAAPVITLPIVRLIRETLLKDAQQVHVAEVFLGGLLKPLSEINVETNPDYVQYDFIEGIRELLVGSVPSEYVLNVVDEVSNYVAKKAGLSLEDFAAVLKNSPQVRNHEIGGEVGYFATVTAQILRYLGDKYRGVAEELERNIFDTKKNAKKKIPTQFQSLINDKTQNFVGREYVFDAINAFIANNSKGYFTIIGDPGQGKSAILAKYVNDTGCIAHFNGLLQGPNRADQFLESVCRQLIERYQIPYDPLPTNAKQDGEFLSQLLDEVAQQRKGGKVIIAVDALDEVDANSYRDAANILYLPVHLPDGVYFVLTRRRDVEVPLTSLEPMQTLSLLDFQTDSERDVRTYIENRVLNSEYLRQQINVTEETLENRVLNSEYLHQQINVTEETIQKFTDKIAERSENNFMYLHYMLIDIESGLYQDLTLEQFPQGLQGYYDFHWRRMGMTAVPLPVEKIKIAYILGEVREPVSRRKICDFSGEDEYAVQKVLNEWKQFLHEIIKNGEKRYSIYNSSFRDFLHRKEILETHPVTLPDIHQLIAKNELKVWNKIKQFLRRDTQMNDEISKPSFNENDALLSDLLNQSQKWEGTLAGGTKLGINAEKVDSLFQTKISFGNPRDRLIRLTENTFKDSGTELDSIYKQQMQEQFDFYYMTLTVALRPERGARFWRLTCEFDFSHKGSNEPIIVSLFPTQKWRSVMNFGVGMDVGLNGNLNWDVGVDSSKLAELLGSIPEDIKANVTSKNNFKAFLAIPAYEYNLGHSEILTNGEGNSTCYWRIQDQELQKIGTAKFGIIFKVPKGTESITLQGTVWAEPDLNWLTADIRDVFANLSANLKQLLKQKNEAASHFARGDAEKWELNLPKG